MASIHASRDVSLTIDADALAPVFLPLLDLEAGTQLIASQCALTLTGVPSPLEAHLMLCAPGTVLGDPTGAVLQMGDLMQVTAAVPHALVGSALPLGEAGVFGLYVPVQSLTPGAHVAGTMSLVRQET